MPNYYPGQQVRIKSKEEVLNEFDYTDEDLRNGIEIGAVYIERDMLEYLGGVFDVTDNDIYDHSTYLRDTGFWWPDQILELVSEPGTYFGFKVGDHVQIRQWEDMKEDGSLDWNAFVEPMRPLCGLQCTITKITPVDRRRAMIEIKFDSADDIPPWKYNTSMIEHIEELPDIQQDEWLEVLMQ